MKVIAWIYFCLGMSPVVIFLIFMIVTSIKKLTKFIQEPNNLDIDENF